ncbi:MAG: TrkA C-terminal domain-containing protein, partial [Rhodospirillaceae bacterium]
MAGVAFIGFYGWRLIPVRRTGDGGKPFEIEAYVTEVLVPSKSGLSGTSLAALLAPAGEGDVQTLCIVRRGRKISHPKPGDVVRINDHLLLEGSAE